MSKTNKKKVQEKKKKVKVPASKPLDVIPGIIMLLYILAPTYTPNLMAFDTNAPKFLALALVNLIAFILLLNYKPVRSQPGIFGNFFKRINIFFGLRFHSQNHIAIHLHETAI